MIGPGNKAVLSPPLGAWGNSPLKFIITSLTHSALGLFIIQLTRYGETKGKISVQSCPPLMGSPESRRVKSKFSVRDTPSVKATHTELTPTEHDPLVQNLKGTVSEKQ